MSVITDYNSAEQIVIKVLREMSPHAGIDFNHSIPLNHVILVGGTTFRFFNGHTLEDVRNSFKECLVIDPEITKQMGGKEPPITYWKLSTCPDGNGYMFHPTGCIDQAHYLSIYRDAKKIISN